MIIANDLTQISANQHRAIFVEKDNLQTVNTKEEIAKLLLEKFKTIILRKESYGKHSLGCNGLNRLLQVGRFSQFSKNKAIKLLF